MLRNAVQEGQTIQAVPEIHLHLSLHLRDFDLLVFTGISSVTAVQERLSSWPLDGRNT